MSGSSVLMSSSLERRLQHLVTHLPGCSRASSGIGPLALITTSSGHHATSGHKEASCAPLPIGAQGAPESATRTANCAGNSAAEPGPLLTAKHWADWREKGYMVIEDLLPRTNCERLCEEGYAFLGADPSDRASWYRHEGS